MRYSERIFLPNPIRTQSSTAYALHRMMRRRSGKICTSMARLCIEMGSPHSACLAVLIT